jgi:hypothetical protein
MQQLQNCRNPAQELCVKNEGGGLLNPPQHRTVPGTSLQEAECPQQTFLLFQEHPCRKQSAHNKLFAVPGTSLQEAECPQQTFLAWVHIQTLELSCHAAPTTAVA